MVDFVRIPSGIPGKLYPDSGMMSALHTLLSLYLYVGSTFMSLRKYSAAFHQLKIVIVLRAGMILAHGKPWTPEIWKRVIPVFVLQKYCGRKVTKGGETEVAGSGLQQMWESVKQLGCKAVQNACVQVPMLRILHCRGI